MIVADLHIMSVSIEPNETDPPLIVNSDAMLPPPVAFQSFQPIARENRQVLQNLGSIQLFQFPPGDASDTRRRS